MQKVKKQKKIINKSKKICILTIDQSLNGSGVIYTENGEMKDLFYCTEKRRNITKHANFYDSKKLTEMQRLDIIQNWFTNIIEQCNPDFMALEGYSFGSRGRVFNLGELGGIVKMTMYQTGKPFYIIPPDSIKLFATGDGHATKSMMVTSAYREHMEDFSVYKENGEDLADAFWMNKLIKTLLDVKENPALLKKLPEHQRKALTNKTKKTPCLLDIESIQK